MSKITNISNGPRGLRNASGDVVMLEAGQTEEFDLAKGEEEGEWFKFGAPPKAPAKDDADKG